MRRADNQSMTAVFAAGLSLVVLVILLTVVLRRRKPSKMDAPRHEKEESGAGPFVECPLCNSPLQKGGNLVSRIYRPMDVADQLCTINGCPHCYPVPEPGVTRECPVCGKPVAAKDGYLVARLFNRADGKHHVAVTGCSSCSKITSYL